MNHIISPYCHYTQLDGRDVGRETKKNGRAICSVRLKCTTYRGLGPLQHQQIVMRISP